MNPATTLFYDIDTQRDFLLPGGKLYVPGGERIVPRLRELTQIARQQGIALAGSVCRHFPTDAELQPNGGLYPEHCLDGTEGQKNVKTFADAAAAARYAEKLVEEKTEKGYEEIV